MADIRNLSSLLEQNIVSIYNSENEQLAYFPSLIMEAESPELRHILGEHLRNKELQVIRLKEALNQLNAEPESTKSRVIRDIVDQGLNVRPQAKNHYVSDAGLIGAVQQIKHIGIANYGTATSYAESLGLFDVKHLLAENLHEEKTLDKKLTELAETRINTGARNAFSPK